MIRIVDGRVVWEGAASTDAQDDHSFRFVFAALASTHSNPLGALLTLLELLLTFMVADLPLRPGEPAAIHGDVLRMMGRFMIEHNTPDSIKEARGLIEAVFAAPG